MHIACVLLSVVVFKNWMWKGNISRYLNQFLNEADPFQLYCSNDQRQLIWMSLRIIRLQEADQKTISPPFWEQIRYTA